MRKVASEGEVNPGVVERVPGSGRPPVETHRRERGDQDEDGEMQSGEPVWRLHFRRDHTS